MNKEIKRLNDVIYVTEYNRAKALREIREFKNSMIGKNMEDETSLGIDHIIKQSERYAQKIDLAGYNLEPIKIELYENKFIDM